MPPHVRLVAVRDAAGELLAQRRERLRPSAELLAGDGGVVGIEVERLLLRHRRRAGTTGATGSAIFPAPAGTPRAGKQGGGERRRTNHRK